MSSLLSLRRLVLLVLATCLLFVAGCQNLWPWSKTDTKPQYVADQPVDAMRLRRALYAFSDRFAAQVAGTADEIADATTDRVVREMTLYWKLRVIPTMQSIVVERDPRYAYINAWALCVLMRRYLEDNVAEFGDQQHLAIAVAKTAQDGIEAIGKEILTSGDFDAAKKEIEAYAHGNPMTGKFAGAVKKASESARTRRDLNVMHYLSVPVSGLSQGAEAIDRIGQVAAVMTEVMQHMPERTRWQTELLVLQLVSQGAVAEALDDFGTAAHSLGSVAVTAETLPTEVVKELEKFLASTTEAQTDLRKTLEDARSLSESLTQSGAAWGATAEKVDSIVTTIQEMSDSGDEETSAVSTEVSTEAPSGDSTPFDINDYTRAAEAIRAGAIEIRAILDDLEAGKMSPAVVAVDKSAESSIDHATAGARILVDQIVYRGFILVVGFFISLLLYRLISSKLLQSYGSRGVVSKDEQ